MEEFEFDYANEHLVGVNFRELCLNNSNFRGADLSGADLSGADLRYSDLSHADLSYASLQNADLEDTNLYGAKLKGANLDGADLRDAVLTCADLRHASLIKVSMDGAILRHADLHGANLNGADLEGADLTDTDLRRVSLVKTDLSGAVLTDAILPEGIPTVPNIHKAVYRAASQPGALDMRVWHKCATAHCRAGWVIMLAGKEGLELEEKIGTSSAAALIYQASDPDLPCIPYWYVANDWALADMARLAQ